MPLDRQVLAGNVVRSSATLVSDEDANDEHARRRVGASEMVAVEEGAVNENLGGSSSTQSLAANGVGPFDPIPTALEG